MSENTNYVTADQLEAALVRLSESLLVRIEAVFMAFQVKIDEKLDRRFAEFEIKMELAMDRKLEAFAARIEIRMEDLMDAKIEQLAVMTRRGFIELREYVDSRFDAL